MILVPCRHGARCTLVQMFAITLGFIHFLTSIDLLSAADQPGELRVMTFNIRYGTAKDGENHWDKRHQFLLETIQAFDPDLLGTQETLAFQRDYLVEKLKQYDSFGVGRDDGREAGEMAALFYKRDRFEKLDGGNFWLSETPDQVASKSWDSSLTRIVSWVKLRDRKDASTPIITYFNTHFDHRGAVARLKSAELLRSKVETLPIGSSVVITGDFNATDTSDPYRALLDPTAGKAATLIDVYRAVHPVREPNESTFSGFDASKTNGSRIDWIFCSKDWDVVSAQIDHTSRDGRTPSDHFPVTGVLRRKK